MPTEETTINTDNIVGNILSGFSEPALAENKEEEEPEANQSPDDSETVPAGDEEDDTGAEEGADPSLTSSDEGDEYDRLETDKLKERLRSRDKHYEEVQKPYIELGKAFADTFDGKNPEAVKAIVGEIERTFGAKLPEILGQGQTGHSAVSADFKLPELDPDAEAYHKEVTEPFVAHATAGLRSEIASLKKELSDLSQKLAEPLKAYDDALKTSRFDKLVKDAAPEALRLYQVREKKNATEEDLRNAMGRYSKSLETGEFKPVDALQLYMRNRKTGPVEKPKEAPPLLPTRAERTDKRKTTAYDDPMAEARDVAREVVSQYFK